MDLVSILILLLVLGVVFDFPGKGGFISLLDGIRPSMTILVFILVVPAALYELSQGFPLRPLMIMTVIVIVCACVFDTIVWMKRRDSGGDV